MGHGDNAWGHRRLTAIDQRNEEPLLVPKRTQPMKQRGFEVVGIHVLLTRSFFGGDILRRLIRRVSLAKSTSAPL